jgi:hypothetical protein
METSELEALLAEILELPAQPEVEAFFGAPRRRVAFVRAEIARRETEKSQKSEWDRWSADMFQKIQAHDDTMKVVREQLDHQKDSSRRAILISIVAAIAAVASAVAAFWVKHSSP